MGLFSSLISYLEGRWNWVKWFFEKFYGLFGKVVTQFWGVVIIVAGWVWFVLEFIYDKGAALIDFLSDGLPVTWPTWTNTVGDILAKANVWYPLQEHFECIVMLLALMAFLTALKILRKLLF